MQKKPKVFFAVENIKFSNMQKKPKVFFAVENIKFSNMQKKPKVFLKDFQTCKKKIKKIQFKLRGIA